MYVSGNYVLQMSSRKILMYNANLLLPLLNLRQQMTMNIPAIENINVMHVDT